VTSQLRFKNLQTVYEKWAIRPTKILTNSQTSNNQTTCAICANPYLVGGSFIFLPGGDVLSLCVAEGRRLKSLSPLERAELIAELVARYAPDNWRFAL